MKLRHLLSVVAITLAVVGSAHAETRDIKPWVATKIASSVSVIYGDTASVDQIWMYGYFPERGDAGRRIPKSEIELFRRRVMTVRSDQDAVLFGATSPTKFDQVYTKSSVTINDLSNQGLRTRRATFMNNQAHRRCLVYEDGIEDDSTVVYLAIVNRPPGVPSLIPGRKDPNLITRKEFSDSLAAIRAQLGNHSKRIKRLEDRPPGGLQITDIGLSAFIGGETFTVAKQTYNGAVIGFNFRLFDLAIEGYGGELFNDSQTIDQIGNDLIPRFTNNHVEGGAVYWAPRQGAEGRWGHYWKLGVTGFHGQHDNINNDSNQELYYGGAAATFALPLKVATPELFVTAGYGRTTTASMTYGVAPLKDSGFGAGARLTLVFGRR